jgi:hypothetical protein
MSDADHSMFEWFLQEGARRAFLESLRDVPKSAPSPDPVVEAMREVEALPRAGSRPRRRAASSRSWRACEFYAGRHKSRNDPPTT